MANKILVTGATGRVGGRAISTLAARGEDVRAAVRDPQRAAQALPRAVEVATFDYERPETFTQAFAGVEHVLLIAPPGGTSGPSRGRGGSSGRRAPRVHLGDGRRRE